MSESNFDQNYPNARTKSGKPGWPPDVKSISQDGLGFMGVDNDGQLYWDGQRLKVLSRLDLITWQNTVAIVGVVAAVSLAVFDALRFFGLGYGQ